MSIDLMTTVWKRAPYEGGKLLVLLALCDWAHDNGSNVFPSIPELAKKARLQDRQAQRLVKQLKEDDVLILVKKATGHRGMANEYRINVALLRQWPELERASSSHPMRSSEHKPVDAAGRAPQEQNKMSGPPDTASQTDGCPDVTPTNSDGCTKVTSVLDDASRMTPKTETGVPDVTLTVIEPLLVPTINASAREPNPALAKASEVEPPAFLRRYPAEFQQFVAAWPTQDQSPQEIYAAWPRKAPPAADMLAAVEAYKADIAQQNATRPADNQRPWCQATTWLRNHRWEGYLAKAALKPVARETSVHESPWNGHPVGIKLRDQLGAGVFDTWLRSCTVEEIDGNVLITTNSKLQHNYVASHFIDQLEREFKAPVAVQ